MTANKLGAHGSVSRERRAQGVAQALSTTAANAESVAPRAEHSCASRTHRPNYLSHHLAGIVTAAVFSDAAHIVEEIALLKTRTSGATRTAAAANPIE